jgi:YHS domain-containing protein
MQRRIACDLLHGLRFAERWPNLFWVAVLGLVQVQAGFALCGAKTAMLDLSRRTGLRVIASVAASLFVLPTPSPAGDKAQLAIKGYDPVAYFTLEKATPGSPEIEYEWDEYRYRFSRQEHRELFKAAPERYAPQFTNHCAMALALGSLVEADPESWLIRYGKLYIFGGPAGRDRFQQDPDENIAKANRNRAQIQKR